MAFTVEQFIKTRPYLYHVSVKVNLTLIREHKFLWCAEELTRRGNRPSLSSAKRPDDVYVDVDGTKVCIRDQAPLHQGNIEFESGWTFGNVLQDLNSRVYFWSGTTKGPTEYGRRYLARYRLKQPVILRIRTSDAFAVNSPPEFCKYNSGSPRCSGGRKGPRGPNTFLRREACPFTSGKVVEVTFRAQMKLPNAVEIAESYAGPWADIDELRS